MNEQQIKEIFSDEAFVNSILEMETPQDVQKALSEKGLDLSLEEINTIKNTLINNDNEGELSEDDLENVAGGVAVTTVICGLIIGAAAASGTFQLGKAIHNWTRRRW